MAWNLGAILVKFKVDTTNWVKGHKVVKADIRALGKAITALGAALTGFAATTVREFGTFDKAIREALAVSDVTTEQFAEMSKMAEDWSVRLNKAATETAKGFYFLGSAGLSATEQMQSFTSVVKMARAMTVDVGQAAEGLVDIMKAFNITFDESTSVANTLVKTIITSNQVFSDLAKSMSYVSSTAELANNEIYEVAAMLGVMANAGIKGSYAGTGLRRSFLNLMGPTADMKRLLKELNIEIYDSDRVMKPYMILMGEFADALRNYSDEYKAMAFKTLFGVRAVAGQIKLFQMGKKELMAYASELKNAADTMDMVVKKQMAALLHQMGNVWREIQKLARSIGETLVPNIRVFAAEAVTFIRNLDKWVDANKQLVKTIMKTTAAVGGLALVLGPLLYVLPNMVTSVKLLAKAFATLLIPIVKIVLPLAAAIALFYVFRAMWNLWWRDTAMRVVDRFIFEFEDFKKTIYNTWGGLWEDMVDIVNDFTNKFKAWSQLFVDDWAATIKDTNATWEEFAIKGFGVFGRLAVAASRFAGDVGKSVSATAAFYTHLIKGEAEEAMKVWDVPWEENVEVLFGGVAEGAEFTKRKALELGAVMEKVIKKEIEGTKILGGEMKKLAIEDFERIKRILTDTYPELAKFIAKMQELLLGPGIIPGIPTPPGRVGGVEEKVGDAGASQFAKTWKGAIKAVIEDFRTLDQMIKNSMEDIVSGWESSINEFLQLTGTFGDKLKNLMDDIFNAVYQSFISTISEMAAQKMFRAFLGGGIVSYRDPMQATIGGTTHFDAVTGAGISRGAQKVSVVVNNSGEPLNVAKATVDERSGIINIVLEAIDTDANFRDAIRG